jgi:hypothetical protein
MSLSVQEEKPGQNWDDWHVQETYKSMVTLGQGALKLTFALNGAAIIAIMTFLGNLSTPGTPAPNMRGPLVCFLVGLVCSGLATGTAYLTQFFNFNESIGNTLKRGDKYVHEYWLWGTGTLLVLSIGAFACGACVAVWRI